MLTIDELYQEIADVLIEIVPERWSTVAVNARVNGMDSKVSIVYFPLKGNNPIFGDDIPTTFKAYKTLYPQLIEELEVTFSQLWYAVKEQEGETFTNVSYSLKQDGTIDVHYSEEVVNDDAVFVEQWMAQYKANE